MVSAIALTPQYAINGAISKVATKEVINASKYSLNFSANFFEYKNFTELNNANNKVKPTQTI